MNYKLFFRGLVQFLAITTFLMFFILAQSDFLLTQDSYMLKISVLQNIMQIEEDDYPKIVNHASDVANFILEVEGKMRDDKNQFFNFQ